MNKFIFKLHIESFDICTGGSKCVENYCICPTDKYFSQKHKICKSFKDQNFISNNNNINQINLNKNLELTTLKLVTNNKTNTKYSKNFFII